MTRQGNPENQEFRDGQYIEKTENTISKVYVTGDCHGDFRKLSNRSFSEQREMAQSCLGEIESSRGGQRQGREEKNGCVIITGDFGYWDTDSKEQQYWLSWLEQRSFAVLWLDGNHENFDLLDRLPITSWHGGKVQFLSPSVIHLMRGQVYEIAGKKLFTFGGAASHDTEVILEAEDPMLKQKVHRLRKRKIPYRIRNVSWWERELPSQEEMDEGLQNLEKNGWNVDFILTHCCAGSTQRQYFGAEYTENALTEYLEGIKQRCEYQKWFFGHYHKDFSMGEKETVICDRIVKIV